MKNLELKKEDFPNTIELINHSDKVFKSCGELAFKMVLLGLYQDYEKLKDEEISDFVTKKIELLEFRAFVEVLEYIEKIDTKDIDLTTELNKIYINFSKYEG